MATWRITKGICSWSESELFACFIFWQRRLGVHLEPGPKAIVLIVRLFQEPRQETKVLDTVLNV